MTILSLSVIRESRQIRVSTVSYPECLSKLLSSQSGENRFVRALLTKKSVSLAAPWKHT